MRRRSVLGGMVIGLGSGREARANAPILPERSVSVSPPILTTLAVPVTAQENRQYSYTDKVSGYFHGRTHTDDNPDWFNGWNIATKRIFHDYRLSVDEVPLSRADASVVVAPHKVTRTFPNATETLSMLDNVTALAIGVTGVSGQRIGMALTGDLTDGGTVGDDGVWFAPKEAVGTVLLVAPLRAGFACALTPADGVSCSTAANGFLLIHSATKSVATQTLATVRRNLERLLGARRDRMEALVSGNNALDAGDMDRTKALLWMRLTGDQLVMKQMGTGIYAGLPWFNDYWGRDTFISITGLLFVNGHYEQAAEVFTSFAALQDVDPNSKTFGRVPNRARPDSIEYNSADGTPRFIITLADLVRRSGDVALAKRLWPVVKRAIDGLLVNNVDTSGLITHDDADTWMDAKEKGLRAWSPRGNRAVDVQALWLQAFDGAVFLHDVVSKPVGRQVGLSFDAPWQNRADLAAERLRTAMVLFENPTNGQLLDHIRAVGTQDFSLRPNALFAVGYKSKAVRLTLCQLERDMSQVRDLWQALVYPWGVATLSQNDPNFYPYHEHWHYYHKDAAYHNGTVWPWLNGIAIQRMIEFNQVDLAWRLFENMNRQALREGAVGSLAECADALPIEGAAWTRRTGTFLQAWSNAEQLRVWQECFLGFSFADGRAGTIVEIRSRLPQSVANVICSFPFKSGHIDAQFHSAGQRRWRFTWRGAGSIALKLNVLIEREITVSMTLKSGATIEVEVEADADSETIKFFDGDGRLMTISDGFSTPPSLGAQVHAARQDRPATPEQIRALEKRIFAGLDFCKPYLQPNLKSLSVRHDPPLTY